MPATLETMVEPSGRRNSIDSPTLRLTPSLFTSVARTRPRFSIMKVSTTVNKRVFIPLQVERFSSPPDTSVIIRPHAPRNVNAGLARGAGGKASGHNGAGAGFKS